MTWQIKFLPDRQEAMLEFQSATSGEFLRVFAPGRWALLAAQGAESGLRMEDVHRWLGTREGVDNRNTYYVVRAFHGAPTNRLAMRQGSHSPESSFRGPAGSAASHRDREPVVTPFEDHVVIEAPYGEDGTGVAVEASKRWVLMVAHRGEAGLPPREIKTILSRELGLDERGVGILVDVFYGVPSSVVEGGQISPPTRVPTPPDVEMTDAESDAGHW